MRSVDRRSPTQRALPGQTFFLKKNSPPLSIYTPPSSPFSLNYKFFLSSNKMNLYNDPLTKASWKVLVPRRLPSVLGLLPSIEIKRQKTMFEMIKASTAEHNLSVKKKYAALILQLEQELGPSDDGSEWWNWNGVVDFFLMNCVYFFSIFLPSIFFHFCYFTIFDKHQQFIWIIEIVMWKLRWGEKDRLDDKNIEVAGRNWGWVVHYYKWR